MPPSNAPTPLHDNVDAFAEVALGFCAWCEEAPQGPESEVAAAGWFSKLYAAALLLPSVDPETSDESLELPAQEVEKAKSNLAYFNGWYYRDFFDTNPLLDDPSGMGDVGDDLLDTYKDIKAGCVLYLKGHVAEAVWTWTFSHRTHWGRHAAGGLLALHCATISKLG